MTTNLDVALNDALTAAPAPGTATSGQASRPQLFDIRIGNLIPDPNNPARTSGTSASSRTAWRRPDSSSP